VANEKIAALTTSYNLSTLERTATIVHAAAKVEGSDLLVRSRINLLDSGMEGRDWVPAAQLVVHDWASAPMIEGRGLDLGLGLGRLDAVRRTERGFGRNEIILLPVDLRMGAWEVQVELEGRWMRRMVGDELLRGFLWRVVE